MTRSRHRRPARRAGLTLVVAAILASGCRPAVDLAEPSPFDEDDPRAYDGVVRSTDDEDDEDVGRADRDRTPDARSNAADQRSGRPTDADRPLEPPTVLSNRSTRRRTLITRGVLDGVLDRGPGRFLRGVELSPHFRDGRFDGWRIVQFMPDESRFASYDLAPGDIIGPVNGRLIAKPPHLQALWSELRAADRIVVQIRRGGESFELRFDVGSEPGDAAEPASDVEAGSEASR